MLIRAKYETVQGKRVMAYLQVHVNSKFTVFMRGKQEIRICRR